MRELRTVQADPVAAIAKGLAFEADRGRRHDRPTRPA